MQFIKSVFIALALFSTIGGLLLQREIRIFSLERFTFVRVQRQESIIQAQIAVVLIDALAVLKAFL